MVRLEAFYLYFTALLWLLLTWIWQIGGLPVPLLRTIVFRGYVLEAVSIDVLGIDLVPYLLGVAFFLLLYVVVSFLEQTLHWRTNSPQRDEYGRPIAGAQSAPDLMLDNHWLLPVDAVLVLAAVGSLIAFYFFDTGDMFVRVAAVPALIGALTPFFWLGRHEAPAEPTAQAAEPPIQEDAVPLV